MQNTDLQRETDARGQAGPARRPGDITLQGRVERVRFSSPESGFVVLKVKPARGAEFVAAGTVAEVVSGSGLEGVELQLRGNWEMTRYGRQFRFSQCRILGSELLFFLSKVVKGLGPAMAKSLIDSFGEEELVRILDNEPQRLLQVKGIKEKRLALIMRSWHKHRSLRDLARYLGGRGQISPNLLVRIYNHFGENSLETVKKDIYSLTEIRGVGFKTADKLAVSMGLDPGSPARIKAAIRHVLVESAENHGHCWLTSQQLEEAVTEVLSSDEHSPEPRMIESVKGQMILDGSIVQGARGEVGLSAYRYMEDWLREFFLTRSARCNRPVIAQEDIVSFLEQYEESIGIELAPEQKEIITRIAAEPRMVFALAGYAGTGKTTICKAILDLLTTRFVDDRDDVICCAFTGMASSRIRKATGYEAVTIHSLLKYRGENRFEHGPDNPLPHRVVLLDEASMVSLPLFYRLAKALRPGTLLVMVGDPAQLPPIGAGNVFGDALKNELVPSVHLERIFRQSQESVLALFANEIRQGRVPEGVESGEWSDFRFEKVEKHNIYALKKRSTERELKMYREENNQAILDHILGLARQYAARLDYPVWDFQVLTPMRGGQLGTEIFNTRLQPILNKSGGKTVTRAGITIQEGDKVVHLQNRDMPVMGWGQFLEEEKQFEAVEFRRVFNGNVGLVSRIDAEAEQFYVVYPERIVVAYDFDFLGDIIELAYALTVHKAQGSQYRVVAIPLTNSHFIMLNNKWFYTAITRAEKMVHLVGQEYALKRASTNIQGVSRQTWLSSRALPHGETA